MQSNKFFCPSGKSKYSLTKPRLKVNVMFLVGHFFGGGGWDVFSVMAVLRVHGYFICRLLPLLRHCYCLTSKPATIQFNQW